MCNHFITQSFSSGRREFPTLQGELFNIKIYAKFIRHKQSEKIKVFLILTVVNVLISGRY